MSKTITTYFTDNSGNPATGLTPTIRIRDVADGSLVVTDASMIEVGDGGYKYVFVDYDSTHEYQIRCDGGAGLMNRYSVGWSQEDYSDTLELLTDMTGGTWELKYPNLLIFYKPDGVTEVMRFECYDVEGNETIESIAKVVRI